MLLFHSYVKLPEGSCSEKKTIQSQLFHPCRWKNGIANQRAADEPRRRKNEVLRVPQAIVQYPMVDEVDDEVKYKMFQITNQLLGLPSGNIQWLMRFF